MAENLFGSTVPDNFVYDEYPSGGDGFYLGNVIEFAVDGQITHVRWYRGASDSFTTRDVYVWSTTGTVLASKTGGSTPTQGAWADIALDTPLSVSAADQVIVGAKVPEGCDYSTFSGLGSTGATSGNLSAPTSANVNDVGGNGVYDEFPAASYPATNFSNEGYGVDLVFEADSNTLPADTGYLTLSGADVEMSVGAANYVSYRLPADTGYLALTGIPAYLSQPPVGSSYTLPADTGVLTLSGAAVRLNPDAPASSGTAYTLPADTGSLGLSGAEVGLTWSTSGHIPVAYTLPANMGSLALSGAAVTFNAALVITLTADTGYIALTGFDADLPAVPSVPPVEYTLTADTGYLTLTGLNAYIPGPNPPIDQPPGGFLPLKYIDEHGTEVNLDEAVAKVAKDASQKAPARKRRKIQRLVDRGIAIALADGSVMRVEMEEMARQIQLIDEAAAEEFLSRIYEMHRQQQENEDVAALLLGF